MCVVVLVAIFADNEMMDTANSNNKPHNRQPPSPHAIFARHTFCLQWGKVWKICEFFVADEKVTMIIKFALGVERRATTLYSNGL